MKEQPYFSARESIPSSVDRQALLQQALLSVIKEFPPQESYDIPLKGFWSGPTGIAYLFFYVSKVQPELKISTKLALDWAKDYLGERPPDVPFEPAVRCGVSSEHLAHQSVRAIVFEDVSLVQSFSDSLEIVLENKSEVEWHSGRAGALYLSRLISHWLPESSSLLTTPVTRLRQSLLVEGWKWTFHGNRYIGAAHGDIGTITQLALSSPTETERHQLQGRLVELLDWQKSDGNWPVNEEVDPKPYVQFCHGAPGFVVSLESIKYVFPELETRISQAISRATHLIQEQGLLIKEPNLCHGIFGNVLCLPLETRSQFFAHGLPDVVEEYRRQGPTVFEKSDPGSSFSLMTGYWTGLAWACLVDKEEFPRIIGYNDV